jgi:2-amino-4-hydroxy-6-hydroxymethyldihydropteridine diphosphokinase
MPIVYLGLGSNLGKRNAYLERACSLVEEKIGRISRHSRYYETEAVGFETTSKFLNAVIEVETQHDAAKLLKIVLSIETDCGRQRNGTKYGDRTLDIDLLLMDDLICDTQDLILPHPQLHERRFVLVPLAEIAPQLMHPIIGKPMKELLERCKDISEVIIWNEQEA